MAGSQPSGCLYRNGLMPSRPSTHKPHSRKAKAHKPKEQERQSSAQRGYGYRWQQARAGYLAKHPLCVICKAKGAIEPATDLDHIVPHKGDMDLFWDRANWQGLCHPCHSAKTAREDGGFGNAHQHRA